MIKSIKIRLKPTWEQEQLFWQSCGAKRFAYNWGLARSKELYEQGVRYNKVALRKEFNEYKKQFEWIDNISAQVTANAFEDLDIAMKKFFKKESGFPKFKSRRTDRPSFYVRYDALSFENNTVKFEKIGKIKYSSNYKIPQLPKYVSPTCSFDGKYWYLSFGFECENQTIEHNDLIIGVDLGVKELAVLSNRDEPIRNINKTKEVRRLKNKLKQKQRQVSRKYELNKQGKKFVKTRNITRLEREIKRINRRLVNIRTNHIHQATASVIKDNPKRVVMEDLNVSGMMKNRHLAKAVQEQKMYEFIRQMKYKCDWNGIEFVQADRWFPSSKMCSSCGHIKTDLKLSDRVYRCDCGLVIDRDKNAAINLSRYELA